MRGPTIAPKLWPISCATTCHSMSPEVETAVPETTDPVGPSAVFWQLLRTDEFNHDWARLHGTYRVPSHAIPTSVPVGQPLMRCQRPALSLLLWPRHAENSDRRSFKVTFAWQARFHGVVGSATLGQLFNNIIQEP